MKKDWALLAAGVFAAATVLVCLVFVSTGGRPVGTEVLPFVVMGVILGPGPGLLVLSARLKRRHAGGAGRGSTLALGAVVGAAVGPPAVLLMPLLFFAHSVRGVFSNPASVEALLTLAVGVVSGSATGFTCAWRVMKRRLRRPNYGS
jgi:hypothetical protein